MRTQYSSICLDSNTAQQSIIPRSGAIVLISLLVTIELSSL